MKTTVVAVACCVLGLFPAGMAQPQMPREGSHYSLIAKHSGKPVTLPATTANGYGAVQSTAFGQISTFVFERSGDTDYYFILRSDVMTKALTVASGDPSDGSAIVQWDLQRTDNQKFLLVAVDAHWFRILSNFGKVLDVYGGSAATADNTPIVQWSWNGGDNQLFRLQEVGGFDASIRKMPPPEKPKKKFWEFWK